MKPRMTMKQITLAAATDQAAGFERYRKPTRRDAFLGEMQRTAPWAQSVALIELHHPNPDNGRPPIGLERMLRIHVL
jgi:IS5 family transposase